EALHRAQEGLRFHDHARAAAEGLVVHGTMAVVGEAAQVVDVDGDEPGLHRAVHDPVLERRLEHAREDGDDVESDHASTSSGFTATMRLFSRSTSRMNASAIGIRTSPAGPPRTT